MTYPPPRGSYCPRCEKQKDEGWSLGPRPSVDPLVAILDVLVWLLCAVFAGAVAFSYLLAVTP